jgi:Tfp pilus assembly protein PilF
LKQIDPTDVELYVVRGEALLKMGGVHREAAVRDFTKALELQPDHLHAHVERCEARRLQGHHKLALEDYRR